MDIIGYWIRINWNSDRTFFVWCSSMFANWTNTWLYLQGDVAFQRWTAFQALVATATVASPKWNASRHVEVFHLSRVLLLHIHQLLHWLTHALCPHLVQSHCCMTRSTYINNNDNNNSITYAALTFWSTLLHLWVWQLKWMWKKVKYTFKIVASESLRKITITNEQSVMKQKYKTERTKSSHLLKYQ